MSTTKLLGPEEMAALEALIDGASLKAVLMGLEEIAIEKAEHIGTSWQDAITARVWSHAAREIAKVSRKVEA